MKILFNALFISKQFDHFPEQNHSQMKIKSIIVEDEEKSRLNLRALLKEYCPEINIAAEASTLEEALKSIKIYRPELLFLDIEMSGNSGFELLRNMTKTCVNLDFCEHNNRIS